MRHFGKKTKQKTIFTQARVWGIEEANHSNMVFPTRCGLTGTGRILWRAGDLVHHFAEVLGLVEPVQHHGLTQCMPRIVRENETS